MATKGLGFAKDMLVFKRYNWGPQAGQIDDRTLYKIKKIGPKEATLRSIDKVTMVESIWGHVERLYTREEHDRYMANRDNNRHYYPYMWGQVFVIRGNEGWDPDQNY